MSFRCSGETQTRKKIKYIYELPYHERNELCLMLDLNNKWKELGGRFLKFDYLKLNRFEMAAAHKSPTDILLGEWGNQNGTILDLFVFLHKMRHFQAMKILKPFVDPKYHRHIKEENVDPIFSSTTEYTVENHSSPPNPPNTSNRNRTSVRQNPGQISVASQSSQRRSGSGSGDTPNTLVTELRNSLDACSRHIEYKTLEEATNKWDKRLILGKGGFGVVYKGSWKCTPVAVKRLESQRPSNPRYNAAEAERQQSLRELKYLNNYKHDNILPLYGYSIDGEKPCLVYQFMSNGSLEDRLQCRQGTRALSWWQRMTIADGSARGLQFLHSMDDPLIHGDIKSANILLDSNFVPKIGDFGLAKEGPVKDFTHVEITRVQGTKPYLPPDFLRDKKLSVKVDTFGFGVVLCELATGLKAYDDSRKERLLRKYCHEADAENHLMNLKDLRAGPEEDYFYVHLIKLGITCTNEDSKERPFVADVLKTLDGLLEHRMLFYRSYVDQRRSSLPPGSQSNLQINHWSPPASKQPLSTSPSRPSHLPQVMENTKECLNPMVEPRRISPVQGTPPLSIQNPISELLPTHSPDRKSETPLVTPQINIQPSSPQPVGNTELNYRTSAVSSSSSSVDDESSECDTDTEVPIPIVPELERNE